MRRSLYAIPDEFSNSPFLALLPVQGDVQRLAELTPSLYARFEKVSALRELTSDQDSESRRRVHAEYAMLRQVLEWLEVNLDGERKE